MRTDEELYMMLERKLQAIQFLLTELAVQKKREKCHIESSNGYLGCVREGKPHGIGRKTFNASCFYEGEWAEGNMHGIGTYHWSAQKVRKGFFKQGKPDGLTVLISQGKATYGWWEEGKEVRSLSFTPPSLS